MFVRLLFIAALIAGAFWLWRRWQAPKSAASAQTAEPAAMVRCAHCRMHLPEEQALTEHGQWYCSEQHQLLGPRKR